MSATLALRIASLTSLLFSVGHIIGGLKKWSPMGDNAVLKAMTDARFNVMGQSRSYLDFYLGFGWSIAVAMLLQSVLLWQMASIARTNAVQVRPMIAMFAGATLISGLIAWQFIFPIPAACSGILFIVLVATYFTAR